MLWMQVNGLYIHNNRVSLIETMCVGSGEAGLSGGGGASGNSPRCSHCLSQTPVRGDAAESRLPTQEWPQPATGTEGCRAESCGGRNKVVQVHRKVSMYYAIMPISQLRIHIWNVFWTWEETSVKRVYSYEMELHSFTHYPLKRSCHTSSCVLCYM